MKGNFLNFAFSFQSLCIILFISFCFRRDCKAKKRIILSGTPIQNDLDELYAVVSFVCPGYLGVCYCNFLFVCVCVCAFVCVWGLGKGPSECSAIFVACISTIRELAQSTYVLST